MFPRRFLLRGRHVSAKSGPAGDRCSFCAATRRSEARDNHWLRLTGDDQRQVRVVRWSVAMRRILLAAAMLGTASGAQAADLPFLRGSFTDGLTTTKVFWQGYYLGGQLAYGSIHSKLPGTINSDMQATFHPPTDVDLLLAGAGGGAQSQHGLRGLRRLQLAMGRRRRRCGGELSSRRVPCLRRLDGEQIQSRLDRPVDNPFDRGAQGVGFRLAADARRLHHGMLPALCLFRRRRRQPDDRTQRFSHLRLRCFRLWNTATKTTLVYGYSAGFGLDVMLMGGLFTRLEYEYQRVTSDIETNINSVRVGLGYKF